MKVRIMVSAVVWTLLLLAGFASCTPANRPEWLSKNSKKPEWWPDNWEKPEDWEKPEKPDDWEKPEKPEDWEKPEKPEDWEKPDGWPELEIPTYVPREKGSIAEVSEFPGIVQVEIGYGPVWVQGCAGSILTSFHILSAARCFSGPIFSERYCRIRAGSSTRNADGDIRDVQSVSNHPLFAVDFFDSDISVLRISSALIFGPNVQQTPIIAQGIALGAGLSVILAGWGTTAEGSFLADDNLYKIDLVITSLETCAERYLDSPLPIVISENMLCAAQAGSAGRDADLRDVGAPLYFDNILVGVNSFGIGPGNSTFPVMATAVSSFTDWIIGAAN